MLLPPGAGDGGLGIKLIDWDHGSLLCIKVGPDALDWGQRMIRMCCLVLPV